MVHHGPFGKMVLKVRRHAQVVSQLGQELLGGQERGAAADEQGEILGHVALLDRVHADILQGAAEQRDRGGAVELAAVLQAAVQAKMDATGLVEVGRPCWCWL